jgi:hypothetical protein
MKNDAVKAGAIALLLLLMAPAVAATATPPPGKVDAGFLSGLRDILQGTKENLGGFLDAGVDTMFRDWLADPAAEWALPMPAGPTYRPKHPYDVPVLNESRRIVDEMLANQYRDVFFQDALRRSRGYADRAAAYARACERGGFASSAEELARLRLATGQRKQHLDELAADIRGAVRGIRGEFERLRGRDTPGESMVGIGGGEIFFAGAQSGLDVLADVIDKRPPHLRTAMRPEWQRQLNLSRMPASRLGRLTRLGGRTVGVVNTLANLFDLGVVSTEAMRMMALIPHMAEWEALATYIEGLSEQYGRLMTTQGELLDRMQSQFDEDACKRCQAAATTAAPLPQPAPPATRPPSVRPSATRPAPTPEPPRPPVRPAEKPPVKPPVGR